MKKLLIMTAAIAAVYSESVPATAKITEAERAKLEVLELRRRLADAEGRIALLLHQALQSQMCERVGAPLSNCAIDLGGDGEIKNIAAAKAAPQEKSK